MKKFEKFIKRYKIFLLLLVINIAYIVLDPVLGKESVEITLDNIKEMLLVIPPIFILLGLLDVWVEKETMIKYMGKGSGFTGSFVAFALGAVAAGPLYAAFPVAGIFIKKGVKLFNVFLFIGAWSTAKIPLLLFEASSLGVGYMLLRFSFNIFGIIAIAFFLERSTSEESRKNVYNIAEEI